MKGLDARILLWTFLVALVSGAALMIWFDTDAEAHRAALPAIGMALRSVHGATSALLLLGALWHLVSRLRRRGTASAARTGGWALAVVALAAWTGAASAQTGAAGQLLGSVGLPHDTATVLAVSLLHVGLGAVTVGLFLYFHLARHGWRRLRGTTRHAIIGLGAVLVVSLLGTAAPGTKGAWSGGTTLAVPPWAYLWAWPFLAAAFAVGLAGKTDGTSAK